MSLLTFAPAAAELIRTLQAVPLTVVCVHSSLVHREAPESFFCAAILAPADAEVLEQLAVVDDPAELLEEVEVCEASDGQQLIVLSRVRGIEPTMQ